MNHFDKQLLNPVEVIRTSAFLYPIHGLFYFLANRALIAYYLTILIPQVLIMFSVYVIIMITFFPTFGFLSIIFMGPGGLAWTWVTIFQLSVQISSTLVILFLMPDIEKQIYEAILSRECAEDVVMLGKLRRIKSVPFLVKFTKVVFSIPTWTVVPYLIGRMIIIFLFNMIPVIGPFAIAYIKAPTRGLQAHSRYFMLKGYDDAKINQYYKERKVEYIGFGLVANLLESMPFLNLLFLYTDTVGAALWAAKMEARSKQEAALKARDVELSEVIATFGSRQDEAVTTSIINGYLQVNEETQEVEIEEANEEVFPLATTLPPIIEVEVEAEIDQGSVSAPLP